jgi:hypothetical protein
MEDYVLGVSEPSDPLRREKNVGFAEDLLRTEIDQRNARKEGQESSARWIVLTVVALMTLLLTLSKEAGILNNASSWALRGSFIATLLAAIGTVFCAGGVLVPRTYERLGGDGLGAFNKAEFLDRPSHEVKGRVVASFIEIATKMDELHEAKARWLRRSLIMLGISLVFIVAQGIALGVDPPAAHPTAPAKIHIRRWNWQSQITCNLKSAGRPEQLRTLRCQTSPSPR